MLASSRGRIQSCVVSAPDKEMPPRQFEHCGGKGKQKDDAWGSRPCHSRRGRWEDPAGDERNGLWRSGHGPSGKDPKDERQKEAS